MSKINWKKVNGFKDSQGVSLGQSSKDSKVLLIFLRHFGCTYCKKVVSEFSKLTAAGKVPDVKTVFVHMSDLKRGDEFFESYNLGGVAHISNPKKELYELFGLKKGSLNEIIGPKVILSGVKDLFKFGIGKIEGDGFQMQGAFLLSDETVEKSYKSKIVSETVNLTRFLDIT